MVGQSHLAIPVRSVMLFAVVIADEDHIQIIDGAVTIDILGYPTGRSILAVVIADEDHIQIVGGAILVHIPGRVGRVFKRPDLPFADSEHLPICNRGGSAAMIVMPHFSASGGIQRVNGLVIDFMNIGIGSIRSGIFNVADVAIMIGCLLIFFLSGRDILRTP